MSLEDFNIPKDVERWVSLTLTFYVKDYNKKKTKSYGQIWLKRSLVLHPFRLGIIPNPEILGLATPQTHILLGLAHN
jgi:hypothetical protein